LLFWQDRGLLVAMSATRAREVELVKRIMRNTSMMRRDPAAPFGAGDYFFKPVAVGFAVIGLLKLFASDIARGIILIGVAGVLLLFVKMAEKYR